MAEKTESFKKKERLCGVKTVSELFAGGNSFIVTPVRVVYTIMPADGTVATARVLISIPKKEFRKAVDRNLIRRRIREAYRKNKARLTSALSEKGKRIDIALIWIGQIIPTYKETEKCINEIIQKLSRLG